MLSALAYRSFDGVQVGITGEISASLGMVMSCIHIANSGCMQRSDNCAFVQLFLCTSVLRFFKPKFFLQALEAIGIQFRFTG
jgi:hypothetical protein